MRTLLHVAAANLLGYLADLKAGDASESALCPVEGGASPAPIAAAADAEVAIAKTKAEGLLRTSTRSTLNNRVFLRVCVAAFTLKVNLAPISVECLFSMTLLKG